ncbi:MAG: FAD-dependent oxidoreductase [Polyangiaceae bacterium]|nr:FAD-dependent oxidoreductase [Polyangiaceae bacterium]
MKEILLEMGLDEADDEASVARALARKLGTSVADLPACHLVKRAIDARRHRVRFQLVFELGEPEQPPEALGGAQPREVDHQYEVVIVGGGPAGLFCAYELARRGIGATVIDRGKLVQPRRRDLKGLTRHGRVDPDSNYCFGEGGAGTYSDGKLYTRAHKRGNVRDVLELLATHGAPRRILTDARPHIGSNILPKVVTALREHLEQVGVRFVFEDRVTNIVTVGHGSERRVAGVELMSGRSLPAQQLVLATGHSARDIYELLARLEVLLVPKAFALGVRIEHPQPAINQIQYGKYAGHPKLPSASYRLAATVDGRGVFSFCMCPGGFIVPAATEVDGLVVNGMSLSRRDSPFANSGLVVAVEPEDWEKLGFGGVLGGIEFQRALERSALVAGGGDLRAPSTRVTDFLGKKGSTDVPKSSYVPGVTASNIRDVLDITGLPLSSRIEGALREFERTMRGYVTSAAQLVGVESRTSSPVRIPRDPGTLQSPTVVGLYPSGEGAGYAGGIMSAAVDGIQIARAVEQSALGKVAC